MMEISRRTRKKAKHKGIMTSQSFRPDSHSISGLGSLFSASDMARSASVATGLSPVFASLASPKSSGLESCWSGDAERGEPLESIIDMRLVGTSKILLVFRRGRSRCRAWPSKVSGTAKLLTKSVKCRRRATMRRRLRSFGLNKPLRMGLRSHSHSCGCTDHSDSCSKLRHSNPVPGRMRVRLRAVSPLSPTCLSSGCIYCSLP
jgi:hypothetical protein